MSARKPQEPRLGSTNCSGFILLEVLVAMSMILGVWISSLGAYQHLAFNLSQHDAKRTQVAKECDAFEIQEQVRSNASLPSKGLNHEFARVPSRHRALRASIEPTLKDKR